jgi:hypothetical protein
MFLKGIIFALLFHYILLLQCDYTFHLLLHLFVLLHVLLYNDFIITYYSICYYPSIHIILLVIT